MEILRFPDPILSEKCAEVTVFGSELNVLLESMHETMKKAGGIGLAANQVGIPLRMFVMDGPKSEKIFAVNPKILRKSDATAGIKEGCLSAPGELLEITSRAAWVEVEFKDNSGEIHKRVFHGVWAVCVQHEIEHLDGVSFLENKSLSKIKRKSLANKWKLNQK